MTNSIHFQQWCRGDGVSSQPLTGNCQHVICQILVTVQLFRRHWFFSCWQKHLSLFTQDISYLSTYYTLIVLEIKIPRTRDLVYPSSIYLHDLWQVQLSAPHLFKERVGKEKFLDYFQLQYSLTLLSWFSVHGAFPLDPPTMCFIDPSAASSNR